MIIINITLIFLRRDVFSRLGAIEQDNSSSRLWERYFHLWMEIIFARSQQSSTYMNQSLSIQGQRKHVVDRLPKHSLMDSHCHIDFILDRRLPKLNLCTWSRLVQRYPALHHPALKGFIQNFCDPPKWATPHQVNIMLILTFPGGQNQGLLPQDSSPQPGLSKRWPSVTQLVATPTLHLAFSKPGPCSSWRDFSWKGRAGDVSPWGSLVWTEARAAGCLWRCRPKPSGCRWSWQWSSTCLWCCTLETLSKWVSPFWRRLVFLPIGQSTGKFIAN